MFKWFATFLSAWTIVFAPLAQGKQAESENLKMVSEVLTEMGLVGPNKAKNVGEMWDRTRSKYSIKEQVYLNPGSHRKDPIPKVTLLPVDGKGKADIVKMIMNQGKETMTVEFLNESENIIKINGIGLTEQDLLSSERIQTKLMGIPSIRESVLKQKKEMLSRSIIPTSQQFKVMTRLDLAYYRMHIAEILASTEAVFNSQLPKTASYELLKQKYQVALEAFTGLSALAVTTQKSSTRGTRKDTDDPGNQCIINGFVSSYAFGKSGTYCAQNNIQIGDDQKDNLAKLKKGCTEKGTFPCNPEFFLSSEGTSLCVGIGRGSADKRESTKKCLEKSAKGTEMVQAIQKYNKLGDSDLTKPIPETEYLALKKKLDEIESALDAAIKVCENPGKIREPGQKSACESLKTQKSDLVEAIAKLQMAEKPPVKDPPAETSKPPVCQPGVVTKECPAEVDCKVTPEAPACKVPPCPGAVAPPANQASTLPKDCNKPVGITGGKEGENKPGSNDSENPLSGLFKWVSKNPWWTAGIIGAGVGTVLAVKHWKKSKSKSKSIPYVAPAAAICPPGNPTCNPTPVTAPAKPIDVPASETTPGTPTTILPAGSTR